MSHGPATFPWCGSNTEHQGRRRRGSRSEFTPKRFEYPISPLVSVGGRPGDAAHDVHAILLDGLLHLGEKRVATHHLTWVTLALQSSFDFVMASP